MKIAFIICVGTFSAVLFLCACSRNEQNTQTDQVTFPIRGEVVAIDTVKFRVTIAHHEIPNYMEAMTMRFKVKDSTLIRGIEVGDSVQGTLAVSHVESWLSSLRAIGRGEAPETLKGEGLEMQRMFQPGDLLPDAPLVNQDGAGIRFSNFRGKALAITFVYTRCPLPDFCIRMSNNFARIQNTLSKYGSLDNLWHLITISFDPKFDSPKVLKQYGMNYGADFQRWTFATDHDTSGRNLMRITDGLGLGYEEGEGATITHNLRTVLVDRNGRIVEIIKDNEWTTDEVVRKMKTIVSGE